MIKNDEPMRVRNYEPASVVLDEPASEEGILREGGLMEKELEEWYNLHQFHLYSGSYETKELSNFLGVGSRTIQRWLTERSKPSKEQLAKIKVYLSQKASKNSL